MEELVKKSKNGDSTAFTELIKSIQNDLYRIAKTRLSNDYDINDAIQETMINAFKNIKKLKNEKTFKSWIIKILINECNHIYKKKMKTNKLKDLINGNNIDIKEDNIQDSISKMDFELLIQKLEYEERLIITLFYNSKYSSSEIAKILKMNVNTVKSKLTRAKSKIKKYYKGGMTNE